MVELLYLHETLRRYVLDEAAVEFKTNGDAESDLTTA